MSERCDVCSSPNADQLTPCRTASLAVRRRVDPQHLPDLSRKSSGEARRRRPREQAPRQVVSLQPSGGTSLRLGAAQIGPEAKGGAVTL